MQPTTVQVTPKPPKPSKWWIAVTILAGAVGSQVAIALAGSGTYEIAPYEVALRARPATLGKTAFAVRAGGLAPAHAEAGTHNAPIELRATITGVSVTDLVRSDQRVVADPKAMADFMAEEGRDAAVAFGIKLALLAVAGSAAAGLAISFGRWRRALGATVAGMLTFAVIGLMAGVTYDRDEFQKTRFVFDGPAQPGGLIPGGE